MRPSISAARAKRSGFDALFHEKGETPPHDVRPWNERNDFMRSSVGQDRLNRPEVIATAARVLAETGDISRHDPAIDGTLTPTFEDGVKRLQIRAKQANPDVVVDGVYGPQTQEIALNQERPKARARREAGEMEPPSLLIPQRLRRPPPKPAQISDEDARRLIQNQLAAKAKAREATERSQESAPLAIIDAVDELAEDGDGDLLQPAQKRNNSNTHSGPALEPAAALSGEDGEDELLGGGADDTVAERQEDQGKPSLQERQDAYEAENSYGERVEQRLLSGTAGFVEAAAVGKAQFTLTRLQAMEAYDQATPEQAEVILSQSDPLTREFLKKRGQRSEEAKQAQKQFYERQSDEAMQAIIGASAIKESTPRSPVADETIRRLNAGNWQGGFDAFMSDPLSVLGQIVVESIPQAAPGVAAAVVTRRPITAIGVTGGMVEFRNAIVDGLQAEGVDITSRDALETAFQDLGLMGRLRARALKRAFSIGAAESVGVKLGSGVVRQIIGGAATGAGGEAAGQLAADGKIERPGDVIAEALGELAQGPAETAGAVLHMAKPPPGQTPKPTEGPQTKADAAAPENGTRAVNPNDGSNPVSNVKQEPERTSQAEPEAVVMSQRVV